MISNIRIILLLSVINTIAVADDMCQAISYTCNTHDFSLRVISLWESCGIFGKPFQFYDKENEGLYNPNAIKEKSITKYCNLGNTKFEIFLEEACSFYNGSTSSLLIIKNQKNDREVLLNANAFGGSCDNNEQSYSAIIITKHKNKPDNFNVEIK